MYIIHYTSDYAKTGLKNQTTTYAQGKISNKKRLHPAYKTHSRKTNISLFE